MKPLSVSSCWLTYNMEAISTRSMHARRESKNATYPLDELLLGVTHGCLVLFKLTINNLGRVRDNTTQTEPPSVNKQVRRLAMNAFLGNRGFI